MVQFVLDKGRGIFLETGGLLVLLYLYDAAVKIRHSIMGYGGGAGMKGIL